LDKKIAFLIVFLSFNIGYSVDFNITINCTGLEVVRLSNLTNAHLELANLSNYNYVLCVSDLPENTKTYDFLHLYSQTNSHAQVSSNSTYPYNVSITVPSNYYCSWEFNKTANITILSLSNYTNAHAGQPDDYPWKFNCYIKEYVSYISPIEGFRKPPTPEKVRTNIIFIIAIVYLIMLICLIVLLDSRKPKKKVGK